MRQHRYPSPAQERDALWEEVDRLNQEIRRQQMELDVLKKEEEIIKRLGHWRQFSLTNREKHWSLMPSGELIRYRSCSGLFSLPEVAIFIIGQHCARKINMLWYARCNDGNLLLQQQLLWLLSSARYAEG